ncbi:MAG: hypothetical protein HFF52_08675 [Lawsonibacter sp.]|nr:hypothetical protein [Lawsonibacter sp.]
MARKFKIPAVPKTTPKNIRFPNDVIKEVELAIRGTEATFSSFVITATQWALEDLKEQEQKKEEEESGPPC